MTFSARLNFACFSNVFLKNIDFAWDIPSKLRFRTRVISFLTFTNKTWNFNFYEGASLQMHFSTFWQNQQFQHFQNVKSLSRAGETSIFALRQCCKQTRFFFFEFSWIAWRLHETHIFPVGSLQNGSRTATNWFLSKLSEFRSTQRPVGRALEPPKTAIS